MSQEEMDVLVTLVLVAERFTYVPLPLCASIDDVTIDDYCVGRAWLRKYPGIEFAIATLTKYRIPPEALRLSKPEKKLQLTPTLRATFSDSVTSKLAMLSATTNVPALPSEDMPTIPTPVTH